MQQGLMKVSKLIEIEVPGLGQRIKAAREADPRPLLKICQLVPSPYGKGKSMTPTNWYKIEKEETKTLPLPTLRKIEEVLGVDFGVEVEG